VYPGIGFVPLGASPTSEPCLPEGTKGISTDGTAVTQAIDCPSTTKALPNVVGMVTPSAAGELSGLSFEIKVINVHSISVPPGHIVSMSPAPGPAIHARMVVTIENSLGPASK